MKNAIEVSNLTKTYNSDFKLGPINVEIPMGYIIGLIGENGAGKTTLIKSLLSIIKFDTGEINIFGYNNKKEDSLIKEDIGVVLDDMFFPEILMVKDLDTIMKNIYKKWDSNLYKQYIKEFKLPDDKKIKDLSKGMRKKLEIAVSLAHHPKLLILDEPTSGLDPVVRSEVLDIFLKFVADNEHTILFSTHITSDLEHIADKILFIDQGQILLDNNRDELLENYGILKCDIEDFSKIFKEDIVSYRKQKYNYEILIKDKEKIAKKYKNFIIDKITLEELMVLIIKGEK